MSDIYTALAALDERRRQNLAEREALIANKQAGIDSEDWSGLKTRTDIPYDDSNNLFTRTARQGINWGKNALVDLVSGQMKLDNLKQAADRERQALAGNYDTKGGLEELANMSMDMIFPLAGTIAGKTAKTANLDLLKQAQDMKAAGKSEDEIFKATDWWLNHPDGQPRFEIDDSEYFINESYLMPPKQKMLNDADKLKKAGKEHEAWALERENRDLSDFGEYSVAPFVIGQHPNMNKAYPEVMGYPITPTDSLLTNGSFAGNAYDISVLADNPTSTLLHEMQHGVQKGEGFSRGGGPGMFVDELRQKKNAAMSVIEQANKQMSENVKIRDRLEAEFAPKERLKPYEDEYQKLMQMKFDVMDDAQIDMLTGPDAMYRKLGGESEARLTQARQHLTPAERKANPFYKNYDVPFDEMIIRRDGGTSYSLVRRNNPTQYQQAHKIAQENASKPVSEGGLGLPKDNTAMDRAKAMGFDDNWFHGTNENFSEFDAFVRGEHTTGDAPGNIFMSDLPDVAKRYADQGKQIRVGKSLKYGDFEIDGGDLIGEGANIMPVMTRGKRKIVDFDGQQFDTTDMSEVIGIAKKEGADRLAVTNIQDDTIYNPLAPTQTTNVVFDPKNIRSRFAAFDPMKKDSKDLLAGLAALGAAYPLFMREDDERF